MGCDEQELRHLDERTEWLRQTYTSLRAGRRNLHTRICQYLRSPRTAKFSQDSMLKQEEALSELDASIDDWVTKLEQAENRRTRVRQKLLEHVAAAATLNIHPAGLVGASESLQQAMGFRQAGNNISTPPRSPTKAIFGTNAAAHSQFGSHTVGHNRTHSGSTSPSPQRVVAQVPSTILEQPLIEDAAAAVGLGLEAQPRDGASEKLEDESFAERRANMQSIRIYADSDVYALLADVENEICKMGVGTDASAAKNGDGPNLSEKERTQLHRAQSHEVLSGTTKLSIKKKGSAGSLPSPTKVPIDPPQAPAEEVILLTQAVFRPDESVLLL
jgi:hypothetical protein